MAITFPTSPTTGQAYTVGDITWTYDGAKWKGQSVTATNIAGGSAGTLPYQSAANTTAQLAAGTSGYILKSTGAGAPVWGNDLAAKASLTGVETLTNKTLTAPRETWYSTGAGSFSGASNYDVKTFGSLYYGITSYSSANFSLNFRGDASTSLDSMMAVGESVTISVINLNNTTAYRCTGVTVDTNATVAVLWSGGTAPAAGNVSSKDVYQFSIFKQATSNFIVFASGPVKYA